jgi:hypothetical protein
MGQGHKGWLFQAAGSSRHPVMMGMAALRIHAAFAESTRPQSMWLLRPDHTGNAPLEFEGRYIGGEINHDFLAPWSRKPEFVFSTGEAVHLRALADT